MVLAELTASTDVALPYRQLASVLLKQYVESHWNSLSDKFCEPVPDDHVRAFSTSSSQTSQPSIDHGLYLLSLCCR